MYSPLHTIDEQYQLVMECRNSGLSDHQWCIEHDIVPNTFYNWVKRLRNKACYDIPNATGSDNYSPAPVQEVVKMEIVNDNQDTQAFVNTSIAANTATNIAAIEISIGEASIRFSNEVDPKLFELALQFFGGKSC